MKIDSYRLKKQLVMKDGGSYDIPITFAAGYRISIRFMTALGTSVKVVF